MAGFVPLDRRLAVIFAMIGFMGMVLLGFANSAMPERIVVRALVAMGLGYVTGRVVGRLSERLMKEAMPPLEEPEEDGEEPTGESEQGEGGEPTEEPTDRVELSSQARGEGP